MGPKINQFFISLDQVLPYVSGAIFITGIVLIAGYLLKLWSIRGLKDKYDFISLYEIRIVWNGCMLLIISIALFPKNIMPKNIIMWHFLDFVIEFVLALIVGTLVYYTLKYYYPNYLNKKLKNLRYKPRISPKTGKNMKLLTEEEEDVYLDEGMQAEEDVFSIDYDVWIDEDTGFTQIEKYSGKLSAKECPRCGYQTLKVEKEELIIAPTAYSSGELMKRYKCTYCGHKEKEIFKVAKLMEER
jgi:DNA-directed RNA polymerase subunit RPC12/RpoP